MISMSILLFNVPEELIHGWALFNSSAERNLIYSHENGNVKYTNINESTDDKSKTCKN